MHCFFKNETNVFSFVFALKTFLQKRTDEGYVWTRLWPGRWGDYRFPLGPTVASIFVVSQWKYLNESICLKDVLRNSNQNIKKGIVDDIIEHSEKS